MTSTELTCCCASTRTATHLRTKLLATATSPLSRNYRFGLCLAEGLNRQQALGKVGATVEGVPTCEAIAALGQKHRWSLPITESVAAVLRSELCPAQALSQLMRRELRFE